MLQILFFPEEDTAHTCSSPASCPGIFMAPTQKVCAVRLVIMDMAFIGAGMSHVKIHEDENGHEKLLLVLQNTSQSENERAEQRLKYRAQG